MFIDRVRRKRLTPSGVICHPRRGFSSCASQPTGSRTRQWLHAVTAPRVFFILLSQPTGDWYFSRTGHVPRRETITDIRLFVLQQHLPTRWVCAKTFRAPRAAVRVAMERTS